MTTFFAVTLSLPTETVCASAKLALPLSQVILFFLNRNSMPPVSCLTASLRWPCIASRSISGVTLMPSLAIAPPAAARSEEHTSELQSLMRISYAVFCLKKKNKNRKNSYTHDIHTHIVYCLLTQTTTHNNKQTIITKK